MHIGMYMYLLLSWNVLHYTCILVVKLEYISLREYVCTYVRAQVCITCVLRTDAVCRLIPCVCCVYMLGIIPRVEFLSGKHIDYL